MKLTDFLKKDTKRYAPALICHGPCHCLTSGYSIATFAKHLKEMQTLRGAWRDYQIEQKRIDWKRRQQSLRDLNTKGVLCGVCDKKAVWKKGGTDDEGDESYEWYECANCGFQSEL